MKKMFVTLEIELHDEWKNDVRPIEHSRDTFSDKAACALVLQDLSGDMRVHGDVKVLTVIAEHTHNGYPKITVKTCRVEAERKSPRKKVTASSTKNSRKIVWKKSAPTGNDK